MATGVSSTLGVTDTVGMLFWEVRLFLLLWSLQDDTGVHFKAAVIFGVVHFSSFFRLLTSALI